MDLQEAAEIIIGTCVKSGAGKVSIKGETKEGDAVWMVVGITEPELIPVVRKAIEDYDNNVTVISQDEIKTMVNVANRWRRTPVVDDDFPLLRDQFDGFLDRLTKKLKGD